MTIFVKEIDMKKIDEKKINEKKNGNRLRMMKRRRGCQNANGKDQDRKQKQKTGECHSGKDTEFGDIEGFRYSRNYR